MIFSVLSLLLLNKLDDYVYLGVGLQLNCVGQPKQADQNHRKTEGARSCFCFPVQLQPRGLRVHHDEELILHAHNLFFWFMVRKVHDKTGSHFYFSRHFVKMCSISTSILKSVAALRPGFKDGSPLFFICLEIEMMDMKMTMVGSSFFLYLIFLLSEFMRVIRDTSCCRKEQKPRVARWRVSVQNRVVLSRGVCTHLSFKLPCGNYGW